MSFSTFFLMVMVAYIFYYLVVIAFDLVNKSRERPDNDSSVQYDFGHDRRPKIATLEVNENVQTGKRHVTLKDGEQSVAEDIIEENKLHSRVDLSLETSSKEENLLAILKNKPSIKAH